MMNEEQVILVNEQDEETGVMGKLEAHRKGILHRAFSIFIFNSKGEMLLQRRALDKYHSAGLWTNACCSHPRPDEDIIRAVDRRLLEEMGFNTPVSKLFHFIYEAPFDNGLRECEYDHVFAGEYDGPVRPDHAEVMDHAFRNMDWLELQLQENPGAYTVWFKIAFPRLRHWWSTQYCIPAAGRDA